MNERIDKLRKVPGNNICADCKHEKADYLVLNYGILVCEKCSGIHREVNRSRSLLHDKITNEEVDDALKQGNKKINDEYLKYLPIFYRLPEKNGPELLRKAFIAAKYRIKEFYIQDIERAYITNVKIGVLLKRCRDRNHYNVRFFRMSISDISFSYYLKESDAVNNDKSVKLEPKRSLRLDRINATFIHDPESNKKNPEELLMISFFRQDEGSWRHIYLKANDPIQLVEWYQAIRFAKFSLRAAYVVGTGDEANELELARNLTLDITKCGWLWKTGSQLTEPWQRRWCVLLGRRLLYSTEALPPYGKGEIVIGERSNGYFADLSAPAHARSPPKDQTSLSIHTPGRIYLFAVDSFSGELAQEWLTVINELADKEMTIREMADYQLYPRK